MVTSAELILQKDYDGALEEIIQVSDEFYSMAADLFIEMGFDCAADILELVVYSPILVGEIAVHYITWIGKVFFDYYRYQGQQAEVMLEYIP